MRQSHDTKQGIPLAAIGLIALAVVAVLWATLLRPRGDSKTSDVQAIEKVHSATMPGAAAPIGAAVQMHSDKSRIPGDWSAAASGSDWIVSYNTVRGGRVVVARWQVSGASVSALDDLAKSLSQPPEMKR